MIEQRRPIVPVGPPVDPWEGHPLFQNIDRYRMLVPVIVAAPPSSVFRAVGKYQARHRAGA